MRQRHLAQRYRDWAKKTFKPGSTLHLLLTEHTFQTSVLGLSALAFLLFIYPVIMALKLIFGG